MSKKMVGDDILGGTTCFHTHQIAEIAAGQAAFFCEIRYCGQTIPEGFCCDVIIKQSYEFLHHRMVDFLAGDKLAVVEA